MKEPKMSRTLPTEELQLIESIVVAQPGGMQIADIENEIQRLQGQRINRRTLQRRLQKLIQVKRLTAQGESTAWLYKPALAQAGESAGLAPKAWVGRAEVELHVSVSPEGARIRDQVRRPLMHRRPVGDRREF
jgi:hypothetical protein